jgi:hypothetical protein
MNDLSFELFETLQKIMLQFMQVRAPEVLLSLTSKFCKNVVKAIKCEFMSDFLPESIDRITKHLRMTVKESPQLVGNVLG